MTKTSIETLKNIEALAETFEASEGLGDELDNYKMAIMAEAMRIAKSLVGQNDFADIHFTSDHDANSSYYDLYWCVSADDDLASIQIRISNHAMRYVGPVVSFETCDDQKYNRSFFEAIADAIIDENENAIYQLDD